MIIMDAPTSSVYPSSISCVAAWDYPQTAYAFLMYRRNKMIKRSRRNGLSAIKEFTELGSALRSR
jgi:hypothetical protein